MPRAVPLTIHYCIFDKKIQRTTPLKFRKSLRHLAHSALSMHSLTTLTIWGTHFYRLQNEETFHLILCFENLWKTNPCFWNDLTTMKKTIIPRVHLTAATSELVTVTQVYTLVWREYMYTVHFLCQKYQYCVSRIVDAGVYTFCLFIVKERGVIG